MAPGNSSSAALELLEEEIMMLVKGGMRIWSTAFAASGSAAGGSSASTFDGLISGAGIAGNLSQKFYVCSSTASTSTWLPVTRTTRIGVPRSRKSPLANTSIVRSPKRPLPPGRNGVWATPRSPTARPAIARRGRWFLRCRFCIGRGQHQPVQQRQRIHPPREHHRRGDEDAAGNHDHGHRARQRVQFAGRLRNQESLAGHHQAHQDQGRADQPGHDRSRQEEDLHGDAGHAQDEEQDLEPVGRAAQEVAPEQEQETCRGDQPADAVAGRHGFHVQPGQADDQEQAGDQPPVEKVHGDIDAGGLDDVQFLSP